MDAIEYQIHKDLGASFLDSIQSITNQVKKFNKAESAYFLISGKGFSFPEFSWGDDFELRIELDLDNEKILNQFEQALPFQFDDSRKFWSSYVCYISQVFCKALDSRKSLLRFCQISSDQCALFHTDFVYARLFQTIKGPGTEFLMESNVNREGLGSGCNSNIVRDMSKVCRVNEKDIMVMRGEKWIASKGLVHRSPPIKGKGLKRLFLSLDPLK